METNGNIFLCISANGLVPGSMEGEMQVTELPIIMLPSHSGLANERP